MSALFIGTASDGIHVILRMGRPLIMLPCLTTRGAGGRSISPFNMGVPMRSTVLQPGGMIPLTCSFQGSFWTLTPSLVLPCCSLLLIHPRGGINDIAKQAQQEQGSRATKKLPGKLQPSSFTGWGEGSCSLYASMCLQARALRSEQGGGIPMHAACAVQKIQVFKPAIVYILRHRTIKRDVTLF